MTTVFVYLFLTTLRKGQYNKDDNYWALFDDDKNGPVKQIFGSISNAKGEEGEPGK